MTFFSEEIWTGWVDQLAEDDFIIIDNFISEEAYRSYREILMEKFSAHGFIKAGIGQEKQIATAIRGDFVYWLNRIQEPLFESFFQLADEMVGRLNELCFLSLGGMEFHLAHYPSGSFYKRHIDQFRGRGNRLITVIIYLNENWKPGDGGELKIYGEKKEYEVEPLARRCVLFKSEMLAHEVLPTRVPRYSLTGWLLYQPQGLGQFLG